MLAAGNVSWTPQAEEQRVNRERQLEQEERIAKELARIAHEKEKDEKLRQHIRQNRYTLVLCNLS